MEKRSPHPPDPKSLAEALDSDDANEWARVWDAEMLRHTDSLKTWTLQDALEDDKPLPFIMTFRSKNTSMEGWKSTRLDTQSGGEAEWCRD